MNFVAKAIKLFNANLNKAPHCTVPNIPKIINNFLPQNYSIKRYKVFGVVQTGLYEFYYYQ